MRGVEEVEVDIGVLLRKDQVYTCRDLIHLFSE